MQALLEACPASQAPGAARQPAKWGDVPTLITQQGYEGLDGDMGPSMCMAERVLLGLEDASARPLVPDLDSRLEPGLDLSWWASGEVDACPTCWGRALPLSLWRPLRRPLIVIPVWHG